ncbi:embryogenesis-associated protein EMB8 isoform X2 [Carica papaya]|uniref:embryogenesis-associated protein EMB8 isoform X2 n=1 Tax=Carica papaya TaxID=3649 RepID=UPI000B8CAD56|nr:embryogenesis-associated protein EMB8 isoform X2 [Carica papaya]
MDSCFFTPEIGTSSSSDPRYAYKLLLRALSLIPVWHYALGFVFFLVVWLYHFLEFHFLEDVFGRFRGSLVKLTYNPDSHVYHGVVSKCRILHGRYLATPWLSSPNIQTCFLNFFGRPPVFNYRRQLFRASDGGTIALDWLLSSDVSGSTLHKSDGVCKDDATPIAVVIPGLTSDSSSAYLKHLAFNTAKYGWKVVVSNHRGLGGVSITSDCFYNAGWTEDIRVVINYLHHEYPKAPLFAIGTSIGANILVKYLGEDGGKTPIAGAVAVCSPWDLLIGDRFISRRLLQKFYDRALTIGLQGYAQLHEPRYSRLANWEGIKKSRSIRDFDNFATCLVGKFETVDTYYRHCSSAPYVGNVSVPLLCISALDDPVCTREAIPWDECRWVRATNEFLGVLCSSSYMHKQSSGLQSSLGSSIDQGPYVNITEDGMVAAVSSEPSANDFGEETSELEKTYQKRNKEILPEMDLDADNQKEVNSIGLSSILEGSQPPTNNQDVKSFNLIASIRRCLNHLSQQNRRSMWLLAYIAVITSWPLLCSVLRISFRKKQRKALSAGAALRKM